MDALEWSDWLMATMGSYGAPALGIALFLGALGIPLPSTLLVLAAGAFAQQGLLNGGQTLAAGWAGVVLGDSLSYGAGRVIGGKLQGRRMQQAQQAFQRYGGWLVYLSRWLLTPVALPVSLLAGSSGYRFGRFLREDVLGELTWLLLYGGVGYGLGSQWEAAGQWLSASGQWLAILAALLLGLALLAHLRLQRRQPALAPAAAAITATAARPAPHNRALLPARRAAAAGL
ncbi:MAG TPA: DedA family protein [Caldilineaceae bacterium]|nr:DedA family protein [Caldilineaceae bacterium]